MKTWSVYLICLSLSLLSGSYAATSTGSLESSTDDLVETNPYTNLTIQEQVIGNKIVYTDKKSGETLTIYLNHYLPKTYSLAYDVFIMSNESLFAFKVASVAVEHEPQNITWRKRLAQSALWSGNLIIALDQWMYFINHNINPELYVPKALLLANQLRDYDIEAHLLELLYRQSPESKRLFLKYVTAIQNQGFPLKALKKLKAEPAAMEDSDYLKKMVNIANSLDQPTLELSYLKQLSRLAPKDINAALKQAEIYYSVGNLKAAYKQYQKVASQASLKEVEFWKDYGDISYLSGHIETAAYAFNKLRQANAIDAPKMISLVYWEQLLDHPLKAYEYSKEGFQRFKDIEFIKPIFSLGLTLGKSNEVQSYLNELTAEQLNGLKNDVNYAPLIARAYWQTGNRSKAMIEWQRLFNRWPDQNELKQDFLWMLVDGQDYNQINYLVSKWCQIFEENLTLWKPLLSMLIQLGDNDKALKLMKQHWSEVINNYDDLLALADIFTQLNDSFSAYYTQRRALYLLLNQLAIQPKAITLTQHLALSELTRRFAPAETAFHVVTGLNKKLFNNNAADEQIIAWALEQRRYSLARQIIRRKALSGSTAPSWMVLTLALEEYDREQMLLLLKQSPKTLPYRDKVTAAALTGNLKLAEEYAYTGLKDHPLDNEMYQLFKDTMLPRANKISMDSGFQGYGVVVGPLTKLAGRFFVSPSLALIPFSKVWFPRTTDAAIFAPPPSVVQNTGLRARKNIDQGWIEGGLSIMRGLQSVMPITLTWQRENVLPRLSIETGFGYHEPAEQSSALVVGGMENKASLAMNYIYDQHNSLDTEFRLLEFLGQDNWKLGTGQELRMRWQHKLYLSSPDWNLNFYGSWLNYQNKNRPLTPLLQSLAPAGSLPTVDFYMPINNIEGGITFGFNQQYNEEYTHDWKFFAEGGLLYSKAFGLGKIIQGGASTSLFGRDHLRFYGEYSVNQQQVGQVQANQSQAGQVFYTLGISYEYYF